jgi:ankyrin repeat protein
MSAKYRHRPVDVLLSAFLLLVWAPWHLNAQRSHSLDDKLFIAIENNDIVTAERLLREGANLDAKRTNGITPLMNAAERGSVPLISLFLENGAHASEEDEQRETAISYAARGGFVRAVNLLAQVSDTKDKNSALFAAVEGGPVGIIEITAAPAQSNQLRTHSVEPEESWTATVEALLANGADIEARNEDGSTPLDWAASFAQTDILKLLIQRGAKANVIDKYGNTPLISAACECAVATMNSAYQAVKILLDQGADVNARNYDGKTALMMASGMTGDATILELLLNNGADPKAKDHKGQTALSLAKQSQRSDKIQILKRVTLR